MYEKIWFNRKRTTGIKNQMEVNSMMFNKKVLLRRFIDVIVGVVIGMLLAADIIFARNIDMSKAGVSLWVFLAVGIFIILLQLIPAFILFTTFVAHMAKKAQDSIPIKESEELKSEQVKEPIVCPKK
jgi:di/tricarboxylate transporter